VKPEAVEHNLHHPYTLTYTTLEVRSGYVFLTRYREAVEPLRRRCAINCTNLHGGIYSPRYVLHIF